MPAVSRRRSNGNVEVNNEEGRVAAGRDTRSPRARAPQNHGIIAAEPAHGAAKEGGGNARRSKAVAILSALVLVLAYPTYRLTCWSLSAISQLLATVSSAVARSVCSFVISLSVQLLFLTLAWLLLLFIMESLAALQKGDFSFVAVHDRTLERGRISIALVVNRFLRAAMDSQTFCAPLRMLRRGLEAVHTLLRSGFIPHKVFLKSFCRS